MDFAATAMVYLAASGFYWPFVAAATLLQTLSAVQAFKIALLYYYLSYGGAPESRDGRPCWGLVRWWRKCHSFFPVNLHMAPELLQKFRTTFSDKDDPRAGTGTAVILAVHPHGPYPLGASVMMPQLVCADACFTNARYAAASAIFKVPLLRDLLLSLGCVDAGRSTLSALLQKKRWVGILPGGEREQLVCCDSDSQTEDLVAPRPGLFRLAVDHDAVIVPVFVFGERRAYTSSRCLLPFRTLLVKKYRVGLPIAYGQHRWFPFVPRRGALDVVFGEPLGMPSELLAGCAGVPGGDEALLLFEAEYRSAVESLFEAHKGRYGCAHKKIRWVAGPDETEKKA
ncbi:diacylglycerol acyltransferase [Pelagophyceae sp. CCMP2097]|nr:diacylglycerol acyltransferase [Pelagophyceae sp. CCMP2097]